jgi:hypothetical protein
MDKWEYMQEYLLWPHKHYIYHNTRICTTCFIVSIKLRNNPKFCLSFSALFRYWGSQIPSTGWNGWSLQWTARWEPNFYTPFTRCVRLAAGISPRQPRVNRTWTMGFAVDKVVLGQTSLGVQRYPLSLSLHQYSILLLIFQDTLNRRTNERRLLAFQHTDILLEIWNLKIDKYFHDGRSPLLINLPSLLSKVLHCPQSILRRRTSGQHLENFRSIFGRFPCNKFSLVLIYSYIFFCRLFMHVSNA